jgi:serine/threonine protein kinase
MAFRRAIEVNHLYAEAYRGLGEAYMKKGDIEKAEKYLIKAGQLFIQRTEFDEARESILMALQVNPNSVNPYNTLGIVYRKSGDFKKSVQYYELAIQINPNDEKIYYNMAHSLLSQGNEQAALNALSKAMELNPDFNEAIEFKQHIGARKKQPAPYSEILALNEKYEPRKESIDEVRSVIRATDKKTGREVRIIRYELTEDMLKAVNQEKLENAWTAVTQTGRLTHPYAALVYEISRSDNSFFLIEEWIEGDVLSKLLGQEKPLPLRMTLEIAMVIANVLGFMHKEEILHQGLTPADIIFTKERMIKVRGFSLFTFENVIRAACDSAPAAVNPYLSPEHFSDKPLTPASDVFTLGSILYEMMMRERPFIAESTSTLIYKVCFEEPKPFRHPDERLASAVQAIFHKALAKDPDNRYENCIEMEGALIDALDVLDRNWRNAHQFLKRV